MTKEVQEFSEDLGVWTGRLHAEGPRPGQVRHWLINKVLGKELLKVF